MPSTDHADASLERHLDRIVDVSPLFEQCFKLDDLTRALSALVRLYDNPDSPTEELAIDAARQGRSAFWTRAKYHNQLARNIVEEANRMGLTAALRRYCEDDHTVVERHTMQQIDWLIPLNLRAAREMAECRASAQLNLIMRVKRRFETERTAVEVVGRAMQRAIS